MEGDILKIILWKWQKLKHNYARVLRTVNVYTTIKVYDIIWHCINEKRYWWPRWSRKIFIFLIYKIFVPIYALEFHHRNTRLTSIQLSPAISCKNVIQPVSSNPQLLIQTSISYISNRLLCTYDKFSLYLSTAY